MKKKTFILTALCALMALPMSAQYSECGYHHDEYEYSMTSRQLDGVINLIRSTSFDDEKLKVAKVCVQLHAVSTDDIRKIAGCFSFSDAKKKFLYYAIDYCSDVRNYSSLRYVLSFSSEQEQFKEFVDDYQYHHSRIQIGRR